jgi:predicted DNA-binding transcriptional regulator YafY
MRADRLVATLLVLQARGRVTAAELADELEVSVKTARRDLEALSMAGIPVYSQPGKNGGWQLIGGARTDLSGLNADEARTLFLVAGPSAAVTPEAKTALRKLVQALPETFRTAAEAAASAVVLDPARWGGTAPRIPHHLDTLRRAVIDGVQVRLGYYDRQGTESERMVRREGVGLVPRRRHRPRTAHVPPQPRALDRGHRPARGATGRLRPRRRVGGHRHHGRGAAHRDHGDRARLPLGPDGPAVGVRHALQRRR